MTAQLEDTIIVDEDADGVNCDGGLHGHPRVWYSFDGTDTVRCGYCDRLFSKKPSED